MRRNVQLGRTSATNCGRAPTPFTGHPKALRPSGGPPFVSPVLRGFCRPKNRHSVLPIIQLPFLLMFHPWFPTPWIRHFVVHWFFPPLKSLVSHLQSSLQALLHEELSEVKRRRTELKAELRAASKEDRKLRKRRANLVKACNSCIRACSSCTSPGCEAVRFQNVGLLSAGS